LSGFASPVVHCSLVKSVTPARADSPTPVALKDQGEQQATVFQNTLGAELAAVLRLADSNGSTNLNIPLRSIQVLPGVGPVAASNSHISVNMPLEAEERNSMQAPPPTGLEILARELAPLQAWATRHITVRNMFETTMWLRTFFELLLIIKLYLVRILYGGSS